MSGNIAVISASPQLPKRNLLAQVFEELFALPESDALKRARESWGIFAEKVSPEEAARIKLRLDRDGIAALLAETDKLPPQPAPLDIKKLDFDGQSLRLLLTCGAVESVPRGEITALCAAPAKTERLKTVDAAPQSDMSKKAIKLGLLALGIPTFSLKKDEPATRQVAEREVFFYMDIYTRTHRYRACSDGFDYTCLKEKKTYSSQANFRVLALETAAFAPNALQNGWLTATVQSRPLYGLGYETLDDLTAEGRFLHMLSCVR